jgi:hypothetical protein
MSRSPAVPAPPPAPAAGFLRRHRVALLTLAVFLGAFLLVVRINLRMHFGGLFLIRGKGWQPLELKDDLYLGEGSRVIAAFDFGPVRRKIYQKHFPEKLVPSLELEWDESDGSGYVISRFEGGRMLVTSFGRFLSDAGEDTKGLFVGGGLPSSIFGDDRVRLSETGMAYYDGRRWLHIWCSSNEAIVSTANPANMSYPSTWKFLGSRVIRSGPRRAVLSSSHEAVLDGVPVRIDRYAYFRSGETFFRLGIRIRNAGDRPVPVLYVYGDEPWLGGYGDCRGNVGWTKDGIVERASRVDPRKHRYFGMFDCGNSLLGPDHDFTMAANFIEWLGKNVPDSAYFCNRAGYDRADIDAGNPLASDTRFLGAEWGPKMLGPGEETTIFLAIGMAAFDPRTKLPVKPEVKLFASPD